MSSGLSSTSALRWTTLILCVAAIYLCWPLVPALVLAVWTAAIARPLVARLDRLLAGRRRAAGVLVFLVFLAVAAPIALMSAAVVVGVRDLLDVLAASPSARGALQWIVAGDGTALRLPQSSDELFALLRRFGGAGIEALTALAGVAAKGLLVVFVYFMATFVFILDGSAEWEWVQRHSPLRGDTLDRFVRAFQETGRGILVGVGLTTMAQGLAATIAFLALGVPQAWVLGPLTGVASIVPVIGSTVIWGPIAIGLFLTDQPLEAGILVVVGIGVISTIDNLLRPVFARMGALRMPMLLLFVSIFGGLMVLGPPGVILGPLVARLAMEALAMLE